MHRTIIHAVDGMSLVEAAFTVAAASKKEIVYFLFALFTYSYYKC